LAQYRSSIELEGDREKEREREIEGEWNGTPLAAVPGHGGEE
jgi:hypothetical protein